MIADAIDKIEELTREAVASQYSKPSLMTELSDDNVRRYWDHSQKKICEQPIPPARMDHQVVTVDSFITAAKTFGGQPGAQHVVSTIWVAADKVILILDHLSRRDRVTLALSYSSTFQRLMALKNKPQLEQRDLIRLLRQEFRKADSATDLLNTVSKIKWARHESGGAEIGQGRDTLGHAVEATVAGIDDIDEFLQVPVNVYSNYGEENNIVVVGLDLEINTMERHFILKPLPDEIEIRTAQAKADVLTRIQAGVGGIPILFGTP